MNAHQKRIKRLTGQLAHVEQQIAAGTPCETVVPQLLAVKGALDAVVRAYLAQALTDCAADAEHAQMQHLVKLLIKHV